MLRCIPARQSVWCGMTRCTALLALLCGLFAAADGRAAEDPRIAARKQAKEATVQRAGVQRALSKEMPQAVRDLPVCGTIQWTVKEMPFVEKGPHGGISGMGMVAIAGKVYVMGGFIPAGDETDDPSRRTSRWAHRYDPESNAWTGLPDMPARREYTRAIATDKDVFVLGGAVQMRPTVPSAEVFRLDVSQKMLKWRAFSSLTVPRTHMAVGKVGRYLVVAGGNKYDLAEKGYSEATIQNVTEVFDLTRPDRGWMQRTPIPGRARGWTASSVLNGKLYLLGGVTFAGDGKETPRSRTRLQESLSFDPVHDKWAHLADAPIPISGWQSAPYRDRYLIVVGGASTLWNDVPFLYDVVADRWMRIASPLPPGGLFNDPGVAIIEDTIYVAGAEGPGGSHFNHFLVGKIRLAE